MEAVNGLNGHEHNGLAEQEQKPVHSEVELTKKDSTITVQEKDQSQVTKVIQHGTASSVTSSDSAEPSTEPSSELSIEPSSNHIEPQLESPSSLPSDLEPKKEVSSSEAIIESHDDERESSPPVVIVGTLKKKRIPPGDLDLHDSKDDNVPQNGDLSPPQTPSIVITESPVQVFEEEYIGEQEDEKVLEQLVNKVQVEVQVEVQEEEPKAVEVEEVKVDVSSTIVEVVTSQAEVTEVAIQEPIQEPVEVKVEVSPVVVEVTSPSEVKVEKVDEKLEDQVDAPVKPARSRPPSVILVDSPKAERSKKPEPSPKPKPETLPKPKIVEPPKSLNPFGDDDEEEEEAQEDDPKSIQSSTPSNKSGQSTTVAPKIYPTDLNPFGDEDEEEEEVEVPRTKPSAADVSSASLNPFGDFDDEEEEEVKPKHIPSPAPRKMLTSTSTTPTPSPQPPKSPRGTRSPLKKRQAPAPPPKPVAPVVGVSVPSPAKSTQSLNNALDNNPSSTCDNSPSTSASSSVANSRTPTPVPRRSKQPTAGETPDPTDPEQLKQIKSKKRPAPPIPAFKRSLKSSMDEIEAELNQIGDELPVVEQKRQELETWLLEEQKKVNSKTESNDSMNQTQLTEDAKEPKLVEEESTENEQAAVATESAEYEEKMNEFIDVAKKRCKLAQKQKELMYMKREHKLEETQVDIEFQLRKIMSKQDAQKSEEDKTTEADLLQRMMEIIDERNDIIENMIKDENKEIEDYLLLISKVLPEQAKALTPSALHEAPEGAKELVTSPQPHKHLSASKLLKQKTASTLSLLKLKKKKKKDKDKDKLKQDGKATVKDKTDGGVVVVSEPSDDEHDHSIATTENGSLRASMASIDAIPEDTAFSPIPDAKSSRSESRASLPAEPTEGQPKDPELKKHKKSFTISKSTFKKLSKITGVGGHHHNHKEPATGTSTTGSSTNDVTTATITKSPDSTQPPKVTES